MRGIAHLARMIDWQRVIPSCKVGDDCMAEHKLDAGKQVISGLVALGRALGYCVEQEFPVEKDRRNSPAVDVAWLSEEGQEFPLMIFEVESRATNAIANNPVKVFGQPNHRFEKPLFFFHIVLSGGQDTSRVENLERLFGFYNYRTYRLDHADTTRLLKDILAQHRRLHRTLDLSALFSVLEDPAWRHVELDAFLPHIETLNFLASYLSTYAECALADRRWNEHFLRYLQRHAQSHPTQPSVTAYETSIGRQWYEPVHLGILALEYPAKSAAMLNRLRNWQERHSYLSMIGPHFGLSRDYDAFVLGIAPALWGLTAALMYRLREAGEYVSEQCRLILQGLAQAERAVSFFTAVWMLHIAAAANSEAQYRFAQEFANGRGGIPHTLLFDPPGLVSLWDRDEVWVSMLAEPSDAVPPLAEFRNAAARRSSGHADRDTRLLSLALRVLTDEGAIYQWGVPITQLLHSP